LTGFRFQPLKISNNKTQIPNGSTSSPPNHPEPSRRANHNDRNSKSQTIGFGSYLRFGYCILEFICPILRLGGACNFLFPVYPGLVP
jgi:hypothetical protein